MKKKSLLLFIVACLSIILLPFTVYCIDTDDWEMPLHLQLFAAKPEKQWLLDTAYIILFKAIKPTPKTAEYFNKYYDSKSNSLSIPLKKPWHDIERMLIVYSKSDRVDGYLFGVVYGFKKRALSIRDVLGRYGIEAADIETKNDLSKQVVYSLDKSSAVSRDNPLHFFVPLNDGQKITLTFHSTDKVFIDTLTVGSSLISE